MSDSECSDSPRKQYNGKLNRYPLGGCGNIRGDASVEHPSIDIIFNIAATPKGVAIKSPTITFRGEEARFAHLIPSLWYRNPQGGSMSITELMLMNKKVRKIMYWLSLPNGAMGLNLWGSLTSKLDGYPIDLNPSPAGPSQSMKKIALA